MWAWLLTSNSTKKFERTELFHEEILNIGVSIPEKAPSAILKYRIRRIESKAKSITSFRIPALVAHALRKDSAGWEIPSP